ncbi:MAG: hypothetical protein VR75_12115 [Hyphomonadaceae bacterium BRH_c29]|nr:MAG: hypothetical protein VR75_12115 [Hyphomonadaceae bacterium BRH_c29]
MMRFLSILLLLAGLVVAGLGGARLLEIYGPEAETPAVADQSYDMAEAPAPEAAEDAYVEDDVLIESLPEAAPAAEAEAMAMEKSAKTKMASRSLSASEQDEPTFSGESLPVPMSRSLDAEDDIAGIEVAPDVMAQDPADDFLKNLKTVPVAHETPAAAEYKRPFEAVLAIDATGDDTAVDALPGRGNIEEGTAKVSKRVEARLSGSGFAIKAMTPEQQTISPLTENTWRWSVTPLTAGNQELTFDIYAIDDGPAVPLRTFHNTVTVKVTGLNRAIAFADQANPLAVFLGGVGSILAGLFGAIKFMRRR